MPAVSSQAFLLLDALLDLALLGDFSQSHDPAFGVRGTRFQEVYHGASDDFEGERFALHFMPPALGRRAEQPLQRLVAQVSEGVAGLCLGEGS